MSAHQLYCFLRFQVNTKDAISFLVFLLNRFPFTSKFDLNLSVSCFVGLDARQTLSGFVTQVPNNNNNSQTSTSQQQLIKFTKAQQKKNDSSTQTAQLVTSTITPTLTNHTITIHANSQHQQLQNNHLMQNGQTNKFPSTTTIMIPANSNQMKGSHLNANGEVVWSCPSCKTACKTATELQNHLSVHTKTEKSVPCEQCGKLFQSQERVKIHVKVAHGNRSAVCPICGSSFCKLIFEMKFNNLLVPV